jgi:hypothetical protein
MIPAEDIAAARETSVVEIAEAHGLRLRRISGGFAGACPQCGGDDRFSINSKKNLFFCRQCGAAGAPIAMERHITGCDFATAVESLTGGAWTASTHTAQRAQAIQRSVVADDGDLKRDLTSAARYVSELKPLLGTPGEEYLRSVRGIDIAAIEEVLAMTNAIGWHPSVHFNQPDHLLRGQKLGAIISAMTDPMTGEPTGAISRTYVHDGRKLAKAKTLGAPLGVIRLSTDDEVLGSGGLFACEGLETGLASMAAGMRPIWVCGDAGTLRKLPPLPDADHLVIVVDHDRNSDAGEKAARELTQRWRAAGRNVHMIMPPRAGDFNDLSMVTL